MDFSNSSKTPLYIIFLIAVFGFMYLIIPPVEPPLVHIEKHQFVESETTPDKVDSTTITEQPLSDSASHQLFFDQMLSNYEQTMEGEKNRTDVIIRYYSRPGDVEMVNQLKNYKFYLHDRTAPDTFNVANSICYGDSVSLKDIQLVAYILHKAGLPIRQIGPSAYHADWKANAIEIGVDSAVFERPVYNLEQIRSLSKKD